MHTIKTEIQNEIVIQKSKFITCFFKLQNKNDIDFFIEKTKKLYPAATHYCYAYRFQNLEKCSDDGEPSNTAGMPILHVLQANDLSNVLCVVIRYFGGIKLGAGGLVRAYTKSVTECLKKGIIVLLQEGYHIVLTTNHSNLKQLDYILKKYSITKTFNNIITYDFLIEKNEFLRIEEKLKQYAIDIKIIDQIYI